MDHFMQGIFKHMKGAGEPEWTQDDDDTFGEGNLSNPNFWSTGKGKERLELALADGLFDHHLVQQSDTQKNHF